MKATKKNSTESVVVNEEIIDNINQEKIDNAQKALDDRKKEFSKKEYIVKMDSPTFEFFKNFMNFHAPWKGKESLGVIEVMKKIAQVESEGIKNNSIYLTNLHIEATHYFLGKYEGKGTDLVDAYVTLYKNVEAALQLVGADNLKLRDLEKDLVAAQQGIETC